MGSASFVAAEANGNSIFNFKEMKAHIEKMHPELTPEQQKEMFNNCHGKNGRMQHHNVYRHMMHNF